ncbi:electron transport complex subunit RsxC [Pseudohaliea rubra]|uniref:Ion-translocating oxidoreductase complex subunit C n=1 Tax=Pseudohaliea rubra DSM 19751 TaxID=1265313 RepID=A0A095VUX8_9GAMM|nr:electron transport complex subunit RsxC [Pseudohaliea rubra]KGE05267.1 Electron transport complex protein RnfC [Pseudohaliea rubra DSM 19751]
MRRVHTFHGGIHPPEHKAQSLQAPIQPAGIPPQLVLPLAQHIGAPAQPVVRAGQAVRGGELLAEADGFVSVPVHAPTSGTVSAIEERPVPHPSGLSAPCIVIDTDGADTWLPPAPLAAAERADQTRLRECIQGAGIAGMGGAGFPTAVKLSPGPGKAIDTLIINGTECEPYITADDSLMRERAGDIVAGTRILAELLAPRDILIGVEDNKPEAIAALQAAADSTMEVVVFPTKYPSGGEKQLIEILLGKQVPSGGIPADIGVVCQNVGTAVAVHEAVARGRPLVSRVTTVTGEAVTRPGNYEVLLGTPMGWLLEQAGVDPDRARRLIMGGPMMGFSIPAPECPVVKTTNCLLVPTEAELPTPPPAQACIRCGLCAEACPATLLPQQLYWFARGKEYDKLEGHNLFDCIECGACSYVCPSHIPLVQYYRASKAEIIARRREAEKADHARERFEARQARMERLAAEREAKRAERKKAAEAKARAKARAAATEGAETVDGAQAAADEDPIQAAIERAKARKAALAAGDAGEPADRVAKLTANVDAIAKRLAAAREKLESYDGGEAPVAEALKRGVEKTADKLAKAEAELREAREGVSEEA